MDETRDCDFCSKPFSIKFKHKKRFCSPRCNKAFNSRVQRQKFSKDAHLIGRFRCSGCGAMNLYPDCLACRIEKKKNERT